MPYTITENKEYEHPIDAVYQAALGAVSGLEGKILAQNAESRQIEARFDKKVLGKVLGDRTQFKIDITESSPGKSTVTVEGFPIDPVGRKLMFGARKGVTRTVMTWFVAHLEHRLK